jgi:hypothetical protein
MIPSAGRHPCNGVEQDVAMNRPFPRLRQGSLYSQLGDEQLVSTTTIGEGRIYGGIRDEIRIRVQTLGGQRIHGDGHAKTPCQCRRHGQRIVRHRENPRREGPTQSESNLLSQSSEPPVQSLPCA